jgi:hypothetical protein
MGVKVGTLAKRVETARMTVPGGEGEEDEYVNLEFRPGALTLGALSRLYEAAKADTFDPEAMEEMLKPILVSWDLLDDDGSPLPITREGLHKLPMEFVGELITVLAGNAKVDDAEGKASDVTLQLTESSERPPIGT